MHTKWHPENKISIKYRTSVILLEAHGEPLLKYESSSRRTGYDVTAINQNDVDRRMGKEPKMRLARCLQISLGYKWVI